jgi:hypothetical protein
MVRQEEGELEEEITTSDEEMQEEVKGAQAAVNECYRRRAKHAGMEVKSPKDRLLTEEETDSLSEQLRDGVGVRAKGREEIGLMPIVEVEAEAEEAQEEVKRREGRKASRLPLMLMLLCFSGQAVEGSTAVMEHQDKDQAAGVGVGRIVHSVWTSGLQDPHQEHCGLHSQG